MSKRKAEIATTLQPHYETAHLLGINPAAEQARQLRIIELLERIATTLEQGKAPQNK